jgi:hypothetical protein
LLTVTVNVTAAGPSLIRESMSLGRKPNPPWWYAAATCAVAPAALTSPLKCRRNRFGPRTVRSYLPAPWPAPMSTDPGTVLFQIVRDPSTVYWPG